MEWYPWVVLAHVIGAFGFVFAHGVSAFVAFRLRAAELLAAIGGGGLMVLIALMVLKPG